MSKFVYLYNLIIMIGETLCGMYLYKLYATETGKL